MSINSSSRPPRPVQNTTSASGKVIAAANSSSSNDLLDGEEDVGGMSYEQLVQSALAHRVIARGSPAPSSAALPVPRLNLTVGQQEVVQQQQQRQVKQPMGGIGKGS